MTAASLEEDAYEDTDNDIEEETSDSTRKRGRPAKKLYWRKIEDYWEDRKLQHELEDVFFSSTDSEKLG